MQMTKALTGDKGISLRSSICPTIVVAAIFGCLLYSCLQVLMFFIVRLFLEEEVEIDVQPRKTRPCMTEKLLTGP